MAIHKTAHFEVAEDGLELALEAIRAFVRRVRAEEPGTLHYMSLQEADRPTRFVHVMAFADEGAERTHQSSEAVQRFVDVLYPLTVDGVTFNDRNAIA
jgi:quinol monooxygenase YgiN